MPHEKLTDGKGDISNAWRTFMNILINQLQGGVSNSGYIVPHHDSKSLPLLNTDDSKGGLLYDKEGEFAQVNTNGIYKNLNTYEELTTDEIDAIDEGKRNGRFVLDTTTGDLKVGVNDEFKTVTLT